MSTEILDISIKKPGHHGNSRLSRFHRLRRKKEGAKLSFSNAVAFPRNNPYGDYSITNLWNEDWEFIKKFGKLRADKMARDKLGRWLKND